MTRTEILLATAKKYSDLARTNKITNAKKLSQLTYKVRESTDPELIYLAISTTNVCYTPTPTTKQKQAYKLLIKDSDMIAELESEEGLVTLYVEVIEAGNLESGFTIEVKTKKGRVSSGNRTVEVLFKEVFKP